MTAIRVGLTVGAAVAAVVVCVVLASCDGSERTTSSTGVLPPGGKPALHAVYAKDLHEEMHKLEQLTSGREMMQLYVGDAAVNMVQIEQTAAKMADVASSRIPQFADVLTDPKERDAYLALARQLHDESLNLKRQAAGNDLPAAKSTTKRITDNCNACHTQFRGVAGPL